MKNFYYILFIFISLHCTKGYDYLDFNLPHDNPKDDYLNFFDNKNLIILDTNFPIIYNSSGSLSQIQPGNTVILLATINNIGTDTAYNVTADFTSSSIYFIPNPLNFTYKNSPYYADNVNVSFSSYSCASYFYCTPGIVGNGKGQQFISFRISNSTPQPYNIPISVKIESGGYTWNRSFNLKIGP
ncbi:MAG: hypothetical protein ORN85_06730 [Sediminibacterium sp.]|nr:hypothetical protein [Sediminibacterium sp.]